MMQVIYEKGFLNMLTIAINIVKIPRLVETISFCKDLNQFKCEGK